MVSRRKVHAGFGRSIVAAAVFMFLASCTPAVFDYEVFDTSGTRMPRPARRGRRCPGEGGPSWRFVLNPVAADDGYLFGERGVLGEPVEAQSGERWRLRWEGFFPNTVCTMSRHPGTRVLSSVSVTFPTAAITGSSSPPTRTVMLSPTASLRSVGEQRLRA